VGEDCWWYTHCLGLPRVLGSAHNLRDVLLFSYHRGASCVIRPCVGSKEPYQRDSRVGKCILRYQREQVRFPPPPKLRRALHMTRKTGRCELLSWFGRRLCLPPGAKVSDLLSYALL